MRPEPSRSEAVRRYGRFWGVYDADGALVCVAVYKKGAVEVARRLGLLER
jgi:hypothetical protein